MTISSLMCPLGKAWLTFHTFKETEKSLSVILFWHHHWLPVPFFLDPYSLRYLHFCFHVTHVWSPCLSYLKISWLFGWPLIEWLMYTRTHKWKYRSAYDMGICSICPFEFVLFNNSIVRWDYILHFKPLLYQVFRLPLSVSAQNRNSLGFS